MSRWRRYLYLLVDRFDQENYALRRIDASTLFFPTTHHKNNIVTPTAATSTSVISDARLPRPFISFIPSPSSDSGSRVLDFFTLFGRGNNKTLIAGADENGFAYIYDLNHQTVHHQHRLNKPKQIETVSVAVGDALYVMDRSPLVRGRHGFESLVFHEVPRPTYGVTEGWRWRRLKPPPYALETGYKPAKITGYTVVGGRDIWVSTPGIGTYAFDTVKRTWSKVGDWVLPFRDRAHYVAECDSWLGFSAKTGLLCASDLKLKTAAGRRRSRPVVSGVLEEKMVECDGCRLIEPYLVRLGSGKFCVAKFFRREYKQVSEDGFVLEQLENFVVLSGFVMELDGPGGVLRMTKHKSRRYMVPTMGYGKGWVF